MRTGCRDEAARDVRVEPASSPRDSDRPRTAPRYARRTGRIRSPRRGLRQRSEGTESERATAGGGADEEEVIRREPGNASRVFQLGGDPGRYRRSWISVQ